MMNMDANVFIPMTRQRYIIENNNDDRVIDIFVLVVYGTLIFPQSPGYVNSVVVDLIEQIDNQANHVPAIITKTIWSLNYCRRKVMCPNCKCTILSSSIKDYQSHRDENSKQVLER